MLCQNYILQSRTKVLGTVLQYSYFSVISRFPLKTVHPFQNFLAVLPPPTLYKVETWKKCWIHASNIVCGVRGGAGPVWIGKRLRNAKCRKTFVHDCSSYHVDVLRALCCVPSPLLDKSKESMCGRLKLSPFFNILLLVKENIRDLKCLHRFEMPSVRIVLHELQNISQWKRYHGVWRSLKKMLRRR